MFIPTEKLAPYNIDIPIFACKYVFHELGLRIYDEKLGWNLILFTDMKNVRITKSLPHMWLVFVIENNVCFNGLGKVTGWEIRVKFFSYFVLWLWNLRGMHSLKCCLKLRRNLIMRKLSMDTGERDNKEF